MPNTPVTFKRQTTTAVAIDAILVELIHISHRCELISDRLMLVVRRLGKSSWVYDSAQNCSYIIYRYMEQV